MRRPGSGELRNVNITALISQCAYSEIETLAPRITTPSLSKQHVAAMDPADLVQLGGEMIDFLVPKAARPEAFPSA